MRLLFSGYSDDCHNLSLDGKGQRESYTPYVVEVAMVGGGAVRATMTYEHPAWVCAIDVPDDVSVMVRKEES